VARDPIQSWRALAAAQDGVLSRRQALATGLTSAFFGRQVQRRLWQRIFPGVVVTHNGPVGDRAHVCAAVLYAGRDAVASHATAGWLDGLYDEPPSRVHVTIPGDRHPAKQPGLLVHRRARSSDGAHPGKSLPRTRVEETVLDIVTTARDEATVVDVVLRACQRRLTTPQRLAEAAAGWPRMRWRRLLGDLLDEAADGVTTPLERRYLRGVERAHGLPPGRRNRPESAAGQRRYRDVRYRAYATVVELDGVLGHPSRSGTSTVRATTTWPSCRRPRCGSGGTSALRRSARPLPAPPACWPSGVGPAARAGAVRTAGCRRRDPVTFCSPAE
jgi:hypothetical protein